MTKLKEDFILACKKVKGEITHQDTALIECELTYKNKTMIWGLNLRLKETDAPDIKIVAGASIIEMRNLDKINALYNSVEFLGKDGSIIHVRPDTKLITFTGKTKGQMVG